LSRRPSFLLLRALNSIRCNGIVAYIGIMIVVLQTYGAAAESPGSALDSGYLSLYNLDFAAPGISSSFMKGANRTTRSVRHHRQLACYPKN
jgi:hypothetical protein